MPTRMWACAEGAGCAKVRAVVVRRQAPDGLRRGQARGERRFRCARRRRGPRRSTPPPMARLAPCGGDGSRPGRRARSQASDSSDAVVAIKGVAGPCGKVELARRAWQVCQAPRAGQIARARFPRLEHRGGKVRAGEQGGELDCGVSSRRANRAAQRHCWCVAVGAAGELDAEIGLCGRRWSARRARRRRRRAGPGHARQPGLALEIELRRRQQEIWMSMAATSTLDEVPAGGRNPFDDLGGGERAAPRAGAEY